MEVILLEKVGKLGTIGDKVNVKSGFGRNYLIPQGKAVFANTANVAEFEARRAELEAAANTKLVAAQERAAKLEDVAVIIEANAGEEGKLFGSVGTVDIAEAVTAVATEICKTEVRLPDGALREIGEFEVNIHLHADVTAVVNVSVVAAA
jgi:large subunit ribosomal protein L9